MKSMKKSTKFKCITCVAVAVLMAMTAITAVTAMACVSDVPGAPAKTEAECELQNNETIEEIYYLFMDIAEIGENGQLIFDCSDMEVLKDGLNLIVCPGFEPTEENNTASEDTEEIDLTDTERFNYMFVEGEEVNEDGSVSIDISELNLPEGLNFLSFSDPLNGEDLNIGFEDAEEEEIDPEFSYTPSDEEIDEEMFV